MKVRFLFAAIAALLLAGAARAEDAEEAEYQRRWKAAANTVARAQRLCARWCNDNRLYAAAWAEWTESLDFEPDHEDARKALGFAKKDGAWVFNPDAGMLRENRGTPKEIDAALDSYRRRREGIEATAGRELVPLAEWTAKHGYEARAKRIWSLVHRYDPENEDACKAMGWSEWKGRWFAPREAAARKAAAKLMEEADGGKADTKPSDIQKATGFRLARRVSAHFAFEGRPSQEELAPMLRAAEAARALFVETFRLDATQEPATVTGVFLTSNLDHKLFLEKCSPLDEEERKTIEKLGGWASFKPDLIFELWTNGSFPEYHREAGVHILVHLLFQMHTRIKMPPGWIQEGLGFWFTDLLTGTAMARCTDLRSNAMEDDRALSTLTWRRMVRQRLREGTDPSIRRVLNARYDDLDLPKMVKAWSLVDFMLAKKRDGFFAYVKRLGEGDSGTDALAESLEMESVDDLQRGWEEYVDENY